MRDELPTPPVRTGAARILLLVLGVLFTVLATVGAFLPVLPTTPFLLVAAACFLRSSPAIHRRLLANRAFGPGLARWQRERTMSRPAKRRAYGLVVLSFGVSILIVDSTWLRLTLAGLGVALLVTLSFVPTSPPHGEDRGSRR